MSVKKRPDGQWRARYRDAAGKEHARHFDRKIDAVAWEQEQLASVRRGVHVDPQAGRILVKDYATKWQAQQIQHREGTARVADLVMRVHVIPAIGDMRMAAVSRSHIQNLVSKWSTTAKASTVRTRCIHLRAMFNAAALDGIIGRSPYQRIKLPEVINTTVTPLTVEQVIALHDAIEAPYRPALLVGAGCGLRIREALGIARTAVRFLERTIDVRAQLSNNPPWRLVPLKTNNSYREVPAPTFTLDALSPLPTDPVSGSIFLRPSGAGPITGRALTGAFTDGITEVNRRAAKREQDRKAGRTRDPELPTIPADTTFHDLRHHYASLLIDGGESVTVVAARLGNTATETLKTYAHLWPDSADRTRRIVDSAWGLPTGADEMRTGIKLLGS